jgi:hypothetical protein
MFLNDRDRLQVIRVVNRAIGPNGGIMFTGSQDRAPINRHLHVEERGRGIPVSKVDDRTNAAD